MDPLTPLEELGREVARAQDQQLEKSDAIERARPAVLLDPVGPKTSWPRMLLFAGTGLATAATAFLLVVLWPRAIELTVGEGPGAQVSGSFVVAGPQAPLPLRFSDGSAVDLEPGASARILGRTPHGVTLLLEGGRMSASVVHRPDTDWKMRAGPFEVRVTGTKFDLEWNVARGSLTLIGLQGSVVVVGCEPGRQIVLVTGQSLQASCQEGKLVLGSESYVVPPPPPAPSSASLPSVRELPAADPELGSLVSPGSPGPVLVAKKANPAVHPNQASSWLRLTRDARYSEAWAAAIGEGLDSICASASAEELIELADTARYAANYTGARRVFLATRQRFPGTPQAAAAAFNLGRLAFDALDDAAEASRWFQTAFQEQPRGPLAQESLGRLMESQLKRSDEWGAWESATHYLKQFPDGPHAAAARELVGQ
ncbi:MAG: hypothetical protein QM765_47130 [Myxococcales bacterium]